MKTSIILIIVLFSLGIYHQQLLKAQHLNQFSIESKAHQTLSDKNHQLKVSHTSLKSKLHQKIISGKSDIKPINNLSEKSTEMESVKNDNFTNSGNQTQQTLDSINDQLSAKGLKNQTQQTSDSTRNSTSINQSGFNFNGHHYEIGRFSGIGQVPADQKIYQWNEMPKHYLAEQEGAAGKTVWSLKIGSIVTVNGQSYQCYKIKNRLYQRSDYDWQEFLNENSDLSLQTCETHFDAYGDNTLTVWHFKAI